MPSRKLASSNENPTGRPPGIRLNAGDRLALYAAQRFIGSGLEEKLKVRIPFDVYFQDPDGTMLDRRNTAVPQFHQVNVWAIVQRALDFFESGFGLGRRIPSHR